MSAEEGQDLRCPDDLREIGLELVEDRLEEIIPVIGIVNPAYWALKFKALQNQTTSWPGRLAGEPW